LTRQPSRIEDNLSPGPETVTKRSPITSPIWFEIRRRSVGGNPCWSAGDDQAGAIPDALGLLAADCYFLQFFSRRGLIRLFRIDYDVDIADAPLK